MPSQSPISNFLTRKFIIIPAETLVETVHVLFRKHSDLAMLPVEEEGLFKGVIYRHDFLQSFLFGQTEGLTAKDLASKNIIYLSPDNPVAAAVEIFETGLFDVIPIVNDQNQLAGVLKKETLFKPMDTQKHQKHTVL